MSSVSFIEVCPCQASRGFAKMASKWRHLLKKTKLAELGLHGFFSGWPTTAQKRVCLLRWTGDLSCLLPADGWDGLQRPQPDRE